MSTKEQIERNAKNSLIGKNFEKLIARACKAYEAEGVAIIAKTPEPFTVLGRTKEGLFKGRFTAAKAQPDFQGTVKGGRSIVIEAKYTKSDRLRQNVLTDKQHDLLEAHDQMGAIVAVLCGIQDEYYMIPWQDWKDMKEEFGRKYVKQEDLQQFKVEKVRGNPLPFLTRYFETQNVENE